MSDRCTNCVQTFGFLTSPIYLHTALCINYLILKQCVNKFLSKIHCTKQQLLLTTVLCKTLKQKFIIINFCKIRCIFYPSVLQIYLAVCPVYQDLQFIKRTQNIYCVRVGVNPGVSGSHSKHPCFLVSLGLQAHL